MAKLHQIIPIERQIKSTVETAVTKFYHLSQKPALFQGLIKEYSPLDDEGVRLPGERVLVQATVPKVLDEVTKAFTRLFDITLTKDETNAQAVADIVVNGVVLADGVPVSTLLWLEKKCLDLRAVVAKLPVLDPAQVWTWDTDAKMYRSEPVETMRSKKVQKFVTVAPATDKHAAQIVPVTEDQFEGKWVLTNFSGAIPQSRKDELAARVEALGEAVKFARESANSRDVVDARMGESLLGFVFGA